MPDFVYDGFSLNGSKVNKAPLPPGEDPNKWIQADPDWNPLVQAAFDLRDAIINGEMHGLAPQTVRPSPTTTHSQYFIWVRNSDKQIIYTANGVDTVITPSTTNDEQGNISFTPSDPYKQVTFASPCPAANVANAVLMATVCWPAGTNPATLAGIVGVNVIPILDGGGNMTGMYIVPTVKSTFTCGWSVDK